MSSSEPEEPIEPLKHYVMGLGLPFFIVFVAVCVAVVVAQITGRDLLMAIKWGIGLSLFFSFFWRITNDAGYIVYQRAMAKPSLDVFWIFVYLVIFDICSF